MTTPTRALLLIALSTAGLTATVSAQPRQMFGLHKVPGDWRLASYDLDNPLALTSNRPAPQLSANLGSNYPTEIVLDGSYVYGLHKITGNWRLVKYTQNSLTIVWNRAAPQVNSTYLTDFAVDGGVVYGLHKVTGNWRICRYLESNLALLSNLPAPQISGVYPTEIDVDSGVFYGLHKINGGWRFAGYNPSSLSLNGHVAVPQVNNTWFTEFGVHNSVVYALHKPAASWTVAAYGANWLDFLWSRPAPQISSTFLTELAPGAASYPASSSLYGQSCPGTAATPQIGLSANPVLGTTVSLTLTSAPASTPIVWALGNNATTINLTPYGMPGCWDLTSKELLVPAATTAIGNFALPFALANEPALLGATVYLQFGVADPAANALGWITTRGLSATLGNY